MIPLICLPFDVTSGVTPLPQSSDEKFEKEIAG